MPWVIKSQGHFVLGKIGIQDSLDLYVCGGMNFKGLYGIILGSLLHISEGMMLSQKKDVILALRKVLINYAVLPSVSICIL